MLKTLCHIALAMFLLVPGVYADDSAKKPQERGFKAAIKRAAKKAAAAAKKAAAKTKAAAKKAASKVKSAAKKAAAKTKAVAKKAAAKTKAAAKKAGAAVKKAASKTKAAAKKAVDKTKAVAKKAVDKTKAAAKKAGAAIKKAAAKTKAVAKTAAAKTKAAAKKAVDKVKAAVRRPAPRTVGPATVVAVPSVNGAVTQVAQPKTVLKAPAGSVFASILKGGEVRVCIRTDIPPFGFFQGQTIRGFDVMLAKKLVAGLGIRYGQNLKIQWSVINAKARVPSLQQGRCDLVAASFSKTAARAKLVGFSNVYLRTHKVLIANQKITRKKPILAVVSGATSVASAVPGAQVTQYFNYNEILSAMKRGYVDYVLSDHPTATFLVKNSTGFKVQKVLAQQEHYAIGVHLHHTHLLKEVNAVLAYLARSGHLAHFKRQWIK